MPDAVELAVRITGKNETSAAFRDAAKDAEGLSGAVKGVAGAIGAVAAVQGLGAIGSQLTSLTKGAAEDAASVSRLQQAVENTGASFGQYSKQIDEVIARGQKLGFTDDQVRDSLSLLTAQTGDATEAQKRFALAQDLARGANIDVVTASKLLGKVTDDNVNVLARYGISVEKGASETELFAAVQQKFGGQAEEFGKSVAGAAERNKIAMDEMRESMGAKLLPVLSAVTSGFQALPGPLQTGVALFGAMGPQLGQVAFGMSALMPALKGIGPAFHIAAMGARAMGLAMLTPPLGIIVALVAVGVAAYIFRDQIIGAFRAAADFVVGAAGQIGGAITSGFNAVINFFTSIWPTVATLITGPFAPIVALATNAFGIRDALIGAFNGAISWLATAGQNIVRGLLEGISGGINEVYELFSGIGNKIMDAFRDAHKWLVNAGRAVIGGLMEGIIDWIPNLDGLLGNIGGRITGTLGRALGIGSPSKVMMKQGEFIMAGLGKGLADGYRYSVAPVMDSITKQVQQSVASAYRFGVSRPSFGGGSASGSSGGFGGGVIATGSTANYLGNYGPNETPPPGSGLFVIAGDGSKIAAKNYAPGEIAARGLPTRRYAAGTDFVPSDMLAFLHRGEAVIPARQNRRRRRGDDASGLSITVNGGVHITNTPEEKDAKKILADLGFAMRQEAMSRGLVMI